MHALSRHSILAYLHAARMLSHAHSRHSILAHLHAARLLSQRLLDSAVLLPAPILAAAAALYPKASFFSAACQGHAFPAPGAAAAAAPAAAAPASAVVV